LYFILIWRKFDPTIFFTGCEYKLELGDVFQASHHEFTVLARASVQNVGKQG